MKIRITMLTENNKPRPSDLTEDMVIVAWELALSALCQLSENEGKFTVEKAEFVEDET